MISDGVAKLSAVEAQVAAAATNEPRRPIDTDAASYFAAVASAAREGVLAAAQLRATVDTLDVTAATEGARREVVAALAQLSASYAALEGACQNRDVAAARRARQTMASATVALHSATPRLGG